MPLVMKSSQCGASAMASPGFGFCVSNHCRYMLSGVVSVAPLSVISACSTR